MSRSWTTILRRKSMAVYMARAWQTHDDRTWALLEIENCGAREMGIDFIPNHDELQLSVLLPAPARSGDSGPMIICWRGLSGPSERDLAIARLRYDGGMIYTRLGPGERWRFPTTAVEAAEVERACRARRGAHLAGYLRVVTADAVQILHFENHGVPLPTEVVQADAWPVLEPKFDRQPEAMSMALDGLAEHDADSPSIEVVRLSVPTFHLRGFARDDARIPAVHEPFLDEVTRSLDRLPRGYLRVQVSGHTDVKRPWRGCGDEELALARARAVADRIGVEPIQVSAKRYREHRGVELDLWYNYAKSNPGGFVRAPAEPLVRADSGRAGAS